jgi:hypothetical protein
MKTQDKIEKHKELIRKRNIFEKILPILKKFNSKIINIKIKTKVNVFLDTSLNNERKKY